MVAGSTGSNGIEQTTAHSVGALPHTDSAALLIGTPAYFSPELAALRPADYHSDVWALALSLYEAIAGINPLAAPTPLETLERVATMDLPMLDSLRASCPADVAACFAQALSKELAIRPPTARAFRQMLENLAIS